MRYEDRIYGVVEIDEPVLGALMHSEAIQRLQGVLQHGISGLIGITSPVSRFEHSVGVMLLVRRMGASLEEQIAALLHDVSHTAFSHVIDYVFHNHNEQSFHDEVKPEYVEGTDLPGILADHGFAWREFLHEEDFSLLEQPSPALCADRLDYFLRDALDLGLVTLEECRQALAHLTVHDGRIMTDDAATARWFGYNFIKADNSSWSDFREVGLYELAAQTIRLGLELNILTRADLWTTDAVAWDKLRACKDGEIQRLISLVSTHTRFEWDEVNPTFTISTKIRTIDPDVTQNGTTARLSELDQAFAQHRSAYVQRKSGNWPMRVIPVNL